MSLYHILLKISISSITHLDRCDKALKNSTKAPMSSAKSISIGPRVVAVAPKKIRIPMSDAPKMTHAIKSQRG